MLTHVGSAVLQSHASIMVAPNKVLNTFLG